MSDDTQNAKVRHLTVAKQFIGPAINMHVGLVHDLGTEGREELAEAVQLAVEEVAKRYGWTRQS